MASRLLRAERRRQLLDVYVLARLIDDVGDEAPGDRLALLDLIDDDLDAGRRRPADASLRSPRSFRWCASAGVPIQPFHDLVAANRMDQQVTRYADMAALRGYCRLSAEPVGRLVLALWDLGDERRTPCPTTSAPVCRSPSTSRTSARTSPPAASTCRRTPGPPRGHAGTAGGGVRPGPSADRERAGADRVAAGRRRRAGPDAAGRRHAADPARSRVCLRVAVAGFTAGGLAALDAVRAAGADAVHVTPRPRKHRVLWHTARTLTAAGIRG